jgi:hypothetical protein
MATATLISGYVKYPAGQPRDYGRGERINIVVTPNDGQDDIKVWGRPGDAIAQLKRGTTVTLTYDGRSYKLFETSLQATNSNMYPKGNATAPPAPSAWSVEQRVKILQELKYRAGVLTACHAEIKQRFEHPETGELTITEETIQKYAVSLYLDLKDLW